MKNFFKTLYHSFYSKDLYAAAAHHGKGSGFGILAKIAAIISILVAVVFYAALFSHSYTKFKSELLAQVPATTIQNGQLVIDRPSPYYIKFKDTPEVAIIDTSPATNAQTLDALIANMKASKAVVLATKTKMITIKENGEYNIQEYPASKEPLRFNQADIKHLLQALEIFVIPFMALFVFGGVFVYKLLQALIYSLFTLVFDRFIKNNLEYNAILRITVLAILPSTIFGIALMVLGSDMPFLLSLVCNLVFIFFGLKSAKAARYS